MTDDAIPACPSIEEVQQAIANGCEVQPVKSEDLARYHYSAANVLLLFTAALVAAGAAGEARGIERAAAIAWGNVPAPEVLIQQIRALSPSASPALDAVIERARAEGFMLAHDTALAALAPSDGAIYAADFKAQLTAHHTLERVKAKLEEAAEGHAIRARGEKGDVAP